MGHRLATVALAPVFILQGRRVRRTTPRLPEPTGAREGEAGEGTALRLLIVGDSAAAGVGADTQQEALSGRLVAALAADHRVTWSLVARTGATTASAHRLLMDRPTVTFDLAVVALGLNDVLARRPIARWLADMEALVETLRARHGVRRVLLSGVPPMHLFTALPQPLRWYLGATARRYDGALSRWARRTACEHLPLVVESAPGLLASDGFHPGPLSFERWATALAERIRAR
ncbi:MAG TPA: SGNH/GDSL hydrolase family protein [Gemmatimonadaceae bacterium]|nr:SGNH/GDSL hydrolase family protein [Gemmatimonadaceae bacterium]